MNREQPALTKVWVYREQPALTKVRGNRLALTKVRINRKHTINIF